MGMENYNPPQEPWLVILYQDDHIMVVNKPSGLLSVPGRGCSRTFPANDRIEQIALLIYQSAIHTKGGDGDTADVAFSQFTIDLPTAISKALQNGV